MDTIVERVINWYREHFDQLSTSWPIARIKSMESIDPIKGKVTIELKSEASLATITFWNKGDVTVLRLDSPSRAVLVVDDRVLDESENITLLLNSYLQKLACPTG